MKARIAASIVLAVGIALGTAGCDLIAPQETLRIVTASDGVNGKVGSVDVRNAMIISDDGKVGNLVVTLVNQGDTPHLVTIKQGDDIKVGQVSVGAGTLRSIGGPTEKRLTIEHLDTKPGALHKVYFQYGDEPGVQLNVPVLDGSLPEYQDYAPTSAHLG